MFKTLLLPAALQGFVMGFKYDVQEGHCPNQPGSISADFKKPQNFGFLEGSWVNVYDRKELNNHIKCYSVQFLKKEYEDNDLKKELYEGNVFEYFQLSSNIREDTSASNEEGEGEQAGEASKTAADDQGYDSWKIREGMTLNFGRSVENQAVGYIEHYDIANADSTPANEDINKKEFVYSLFDSQYLRYAQILDTDQENYVVLYQCMETAQYYDRSTGEEIQPGQELVDHTLNQYFDFSSHPPVNYFYSDEIEVKPMHFQNVKILWKTHETEIFEEGESKGMKNVFLREEAIIAPTWMMINELKTKIAEKYIKGLQIDDLDEHYSQLDHPDDKCVYNIDEIDSEVHSIETYGVVDKLKKQHDHFFQYESVNEKRIKTDL